MLLTSGVLSSHPDETTALAAALAPHLRPGDTLLLDGPVGAGKSHFARSVILARLPIPEDVPSPTFTLVQTYDDGTTELWHADLYRLTGPDHCVELGLTEAFDTAICLVEWPDRLGPLTPDTALRLQFEPTGAEGVRIIRAIDPSSEWQGRLAQVTW